MIKQQQIPSFFLLEILIYSICLVLFVGLLVTIGINLFISQVFLSSLSYPSYVYTFHQINGILFLSAVGMLFFFVASCHTFFRCVPVFSVRKKPVSKLEFLTTFLDTFFQQWSLVVLLILLLWVGWGFVAKSLLPFTKQTPLYENRAEYRLENRIQFSPYVELKES